MSESLPEQLHQFGARTEQERQESFEQSTLSLVLKQLGYEQKAVKRMQRDQGPAYGWDWFNDSLQILPFRVGSVRIPEFNFEALWEKPSGHPVSQAWLDFCHKEIDHGFNEGALVFRCFGLGRLVATNREPSGKSSFIHVAVSWGAYNVLPFGGYFTPFHEDRHE